MSAATSDRSTNTLCAVSNSAGRTNAAKALARNGAVRTVVPDGHAEDRGRDDPDWHRADPSSAPDAAGCPGSRFQRRRGPARPSLTLGIDLDHPDLTIDVGLGKNCITAGPPEDGHGHGTHVSGIVAAKGGQRHRRRRRRASSNGGATLRSWDDTGSGEWSKRHLRRGLPHRPDRPTAIRPTTSRSPI